MKKSGLLTLLISCSFLFSCGGDSTIDSNLTISENESVSVFEFENLTILEKEKHSIVYVGDKNVIKCAWEPSGDFEPTLRFTSDNESVLKIGLTGLYEALSVGVANIYVTCRYEDAVIFSSMKITVKAGK